jgi:hypothetical protein
MAQTSCVLLTTGDREGLAAIIILNVNFTGKTRLSGVLAIDRIVIGTPRGGVGNEWDHDGT